MSRRTNEMTVINFGEHACRKVQARLDSYIDSELLTESNLDLLEHLEGCATCTREVESRRYLRRRVQTAVREICVPAGLEARVSDCVRHAQRPQRRYFSLMAIAATVAVCFGSWITYQQR